jgi:hypothetical protein
MAHHAQQRAFRSSLLTWIVLAMTFSMTGPEVTAHVLIDTAADVEHRLADLVASRLPLRLPGLDASARHLAAGLVGALGLVVGSAGALSRPSAHRRSPHVDEASAPDPGRH